MFFSQKFWNWVVTHAQTYNPKCQHAFSMLRNASSQSEFRLNLLRCMTETSPATLQPYEKIAWKLDDSLVQLKSGRSSHWRFRTRQLFLSHFLFWTQAFKARFTGHPRLSWNFSDGKFHCMNNREWCQFYMEFLLQYFHYSYENLLIPNLSFVGFSGSW